MTEVIAIRRFYHGGHRRLHDRFEVSTRLAHDLAHKGLVRVVEERKDPPQTAGKKPSALPVVPVLPQTTAAPSKRGARKKKDEPSS